jgi:hypothetical protein
MPQSPLRLAVAVAVAALALLAAPAAAKPIFGMCNPAGTDTLYVVAADGRVHACGSQLRGAACRPVGRAGSPASLECGSRSNEVWVLTGDGGLWRCQDDPRSDQGCTRIHDF